MRTENSLRPVLMAALGVGVLSCMDAVMKVVSAAYPIGEVVGLRYASGAALATLVYLATGRRRPTGDAIRRNLIRAIVVLCTAVTFFTAIARLSLAEAIALTFMAPLLMALLGRLMLQEPIAPRSLVAIAIGFLGVVIIARGPEATVGRSLDPVGIAAALACAFFYALSMVLMRKQSARDDAVTIVALSNVLAFLLVSPLMAAQWQAPSASHLVAFTVAGLLGTCGHLCLAWAYSRAHAGRLGILEYTAFLWGTLFGYLFFAETPTAATFGGAGLIVVACLMAAFTRPKRPGAAPARDVEASVPSA